MLGMQDNQQIVPKPLAEGDPILYEDAEKTVPLFIFRWGEGVNSVHNCKGIERVVSTVIANETVSLTKSPFASAL